MKSKDLIITSESNGQIKELIKLQKQARERRKTKKFVAEGIKMVLEEWEGKLIDGDTLDWKRLMDIVMERFNVLGTEILLNPDKQAPFERFFLLRSIPWLQKLNPLIDSVVGQELSRYSPDEITQIVRGKMYYDLQMVRINGSLIGAVLGGILYGLTIIVEGVLK